MIELSAVARAVLGQIMSSVLTHTREWFKRTPIERASLRIAATHPHGAAFRAAYPEWFRSHQFTTALYKIQQSGGPVEGEALASALIDSGFGIGDDTPRVAREIVESFLSTLDDELLKSSDGALYSHDVQ